MNSVKYFITEDTDTNTTYLDERKKLAAKSESWIKLKTHSATSVVMLQVEMLQFVDNVRFSPISFWKYHSTESICSA